MPEFYQTHLRSCLSTAQFLLLTLVVQLLQTLKTAKLEALASNLPMPIQVKSRRRKLKRFVSVPGLSIESIWYPILIEQLQGAYAGGECMLPLTEGNGTRQICWFSVGCNMEEQFQFIGWNCRI